MKRVKPNIDKPHRCPECHKIPDAAREDGRAVGGKRYECPGCQVYWKMTRTDYRVLKQLKKHYAETRTRHRAELNPR